MNSRKIMSYAGAVLLGVFTSQTYNYLDNRTKNNWQADRILDNKKVVFKASGTDGINKAESLIEISSKDLLDKEGRAFIIWEEIADKITNLNQYRQGLDDGKQMLRDSILGKPQTIIKTPKNMPNALESTVKKGFNIIL